MERLFSADLAYFADVQLQKQKTHMTQKLLEILPQIRGHFALLTVRDFAISWH